MTYWYHFTEYYCPVCTRMEVFRVRVYDRPKPLTWQERHEVIERWDACDAL